MRHLPVVAAGAALMLAAVNGLDLLASAYRTYTERHLDEPGSPRVIAAARTAAAMTPWSASRVALVGWLLADTGAAGDAAAYYHNALAWAPADALLWTEYANVLARANQLDVLPVAVAMAERLAPASPAVQASLAALALNQWGRSTESLRAHWTRSLRYELDHDRRPFLRSVAAGGRAEMFCATIAPAVHEQRWCERVERRLTACRAEHPGDEGDLVCLLDE